MKKLKKSKNKMISGVCGGIANFFNIDPTIVRLLFVILGIISFGTGIIIYIIGAIIIPEADSFEQDYSSDDVENLKSANVGDSEKPKSKSNNKTHSDEDFNSFFK